MFALTFLGLFHMACSFSADTKYFYNNGALLDFDEEDPFVESVSKPEEISPMELRRLRHRHPRQSINEDLGTAVPMVGNEIIPLNALEFYDVKKIEESVSKGLDPQNFKKLDDSFGTRNPFFGSKKYFGERNLFRSLTSLVDSNASFNIIATPYTRSSWEPNFLRINVE